MIMPRKRKCRNCHKFFLPDHRNIGRQRYCSEPECRKASKAASQRKWLAKPENRNYFRGPLNVQRVQEWRKSGKQTPLQDPLGQETTCTQADKPDFAPQDHALQDIMDSQHVVLIGLLAQLTGGLQDDIVNTARHMQQLGQDILNN